MRRKSVVVGLEVALGRCGHIWVEVCRKRTDRAEPRMAWWEQKGAHFLQVGRLQVTHAPTRLMNRYQPSSLVQASAGSG
jgi:hypothetical protein